MSPALHLTITTPSAVLADVDAVQSVRAEDEGGSFGILPGHTDFLTVLRASVVRWRDDNGTAHYCALGGGVLTLVDGRRVNIACRQAIIGDDLMVLDADVREMRAALADADRVARVEQTRLHANAVRQLMRYLRPGGAKDIDAFLSKGDAP
ncbi:F0F1 ATP synthase subunit epsilon [Rhizobium jaguaris]|uniref:ATP synthase epsilon chain n=1 Tax=Rhizobium jaguaris TaxID=1312183 RepID=A0A387G6G8_9HYPH|nr:F0F1 ATP synthase subunit epsilon [Rhizobium jaguaris]AYG63561.1 F0F1 ATP synthase subunit epsilon [Rhizobium jaguaris]